MEIAELKMYTDVVSTTKNLSNIDMRANSDK